MIPLLGLIIGLIIGILIPYNIPREYSNYAAVAILAHLILFLADLSHQWRIDLKQKYFCQVFGNSLLAALFAYIGDRLGISLHLVVYLPLVTSFLKLQCYT